MSCALGASTCEAKTSLFIRLSMLIFIKGRPIGEVPADARALAALLTTFGT
jgi:hypothetical protein